MARFDKYDGMTGGFRALLAAAFTGGTNGVDFGKMFAVGLDANGRVVFGDGTNDPASGYLGALILTESKPPGSAVDIMQNGEIVEFDQNTNLNTGNATAGTRYYAGAGHNGGITATKPGSGGLFLGWTVTPNRLVVRTQVL